MKIFLKVQKFTLKAKKVFFLFSKTLSESSVLNKRRNKKRSSENTKTKFSDDLSLSNLVPEKGIEPPTFALRMRCSTD